MSAARALTVKQMREAKLQKQKTNSVGNPAWQKGGPSPNPAGRPMAARQRLGEKIITNIAALWEEEGEAVLRRLIAEDPATFAKLAFQVLPKEALISVQQSTPGGLEPEQWVRLREILAMVERVAPVGTSPEAVLTAIESGLRAEFAQPVEALPLAVAESVQSK